MHPRRGLCLYSGDMKIISRPNSTLWSKDNYCTLLGMTRYQLSDKRTAYYNSSEELEQHSLKAYTIIGTYLSSTKMQLEAFTLRCFTTSK